MKNRRRLLLISLAVVAVLGTISLPAVHWRLVGWWRREPFYQGRPASYWAAVILSINGGIGIRDGVPCTIIEYCDDPFAWLKWRLGIKPHVTNLARDQLPFVDRDPTAVPVLIALLRYPDEDVRNWAAVMLEPAWMPANNGVYHPN
jgi:hypothetical protein